MQKTLTIPGFLAVFPARGARADDDYCVPIADLQPRDAVGRRIVGMIHPATLQVIDLEYEDAEDAGDRPRRDREQRSDV